MMDAMYSLRNASTRGRLLFLCLMNTDTQYQCPDCGWKGEESEMESDYVYDEEGDYAWSKWICPHCRAWHRLDDYREIVQEGTNND